MTSLKLSQLRKLIAEEVRKNILEVGEKDKPEEGEDSLDAQVDRYLIDYEKESRASKNEGRDFRMMVRRFLSEAEEEKDEEAQEKLKAEDIDVETFINSVIRLIDNYDALLEVRNTILRRAVNFLIKSYEPTVAQTFKDSLLDSYGFEIGKSKAEVEDEEFEKPAADRAGSSPGGA
jgi:hypothetical protein